MEALNEFITSDLSLWGVFASSFIAATLLPISSEVVLIAALKLHPELLWPALLLGTLGNTLGGMVSFGMGWMLPRLQTKQATLGGAKYSGAGGAASHPLPQTAGFARNVARVRRYGSPALLLAWMPLIGDALCVAAGWLRLNPWYATLFMATGKFARYWVIAAAL